MKSWLKRHFIPHKENNHRPHFLHKKNIAQLMGVVLFFELILFVLPGLNFVTFFNSLNLSSVLPGVLSTLTNEERLVNSLPELRESEILNRAAQLKAEDMAAKGYFAHTSPEGRTPWYWLEAVGYKYSFAGENLAVNFIDSRDVTQAWMNSPTHRANIVHGAYTEVGTGVAAGVYKGTQTVFVAQVYGRPAAVPAGSPSVQTPITTQVADTNTQGSNVLGETQAAAPIEKPGAVNRATQEAIKEFQEAATSPRHATDAVLYTVLGIITLALLFNIFIKVKHQHPDLILNGAVAMVLILGIHLSNTYLLDTHRLETSFTAYNSSSAIEN